jgi:hypothetical protein
MSVPHFLKLQMPMSAVIIVAEPFAQHCHCIAFQLPFGIIASNGGTAASFASLKRQVLPYHMLEKALTSEASSKLLDILKQLHATAYSFAKAGGPARIIRLQFSAERLLD